MSQIDSSKIYPTPQRAQNDQQLNNKSRNLSSTLKLLVGAVVILILALLIINGVRSAQASERAKNKAYEIYATLVNGSNPSNSVNHCRYTGRAVYDFPGQKWCGTYMLLPSITISNAQKELNSDKGWHQERNSSQFIYDNEDHSVTCSVYLNYKSIYMPEGAVNKLGLQSRVSNPQSYMYCEARA